MCRGPHAVLPLMPLSSPLTWQQDSQLNLLGHSFIFFTSLQSSPRNLQTIPKVLSSQNALGPGQVSGFSRLLITVPILLQPQVTPRGAPIRGEDGSIFPAVSLRKIFKGWRDRWLRGEELFFCGPEFELQINVFQLDSADNLELSCYLLNRKTSKRGLILPCKHWLQALQSQSSCKI